MIIRTEDLKLLCSKILYAVDSSELSNLSDILQLKNKDGYLHLSVTNKEYFVDVKINTYEEENFNATVSASLFLKLISSMTCEAIEFICKDKNLVVIGNGEYNIPMVYDYNNEILELPNIVINNITKTFNIDADILNSILIYNSKGLPNGITNNQAQRMYYVDEKGAITFSTGACINSFSLSEPVSMLLPAKVVKLFKLFKSGDVSFSIGYDKDNDDSLDIVKTKVSFSDDTTRITAIIALNNALIQSVPVDAIRNKAFEDYKYTITISKDELLASINRLMIFENKGNSNPANITFTDNSLVLSDITNKESIYYLSNSNNSLQEYSTKIFLQDIKLALESYKGSSVNINFGNNQAISIIYNNICSIIPECDE